MDLMSQRRIALELINREIERRLEISRQTGIHPAAMDVVKSEPNSDENSLNDLDPQTEQSVEPNQFDGLDASIVKEEEQFVVYEGYHSSAETLDQLPYANDQEPQLEIYDRSGVAVHNGYNQQNNQNLNAAASSYQENGLHSGFSLDERRVLKANQPKQRELANSAPGTSPKRHRTLSPVGLVKRRKTNSPVPKEAPNVSKKKTANHKTKTSSVKPSSQLPTQKNIDGTGNDKPNCYQTCKLCKKALATDALNHYMREHARLKKDVAEILRKHKSTTTDNCIFCHQPHKDYSHKQWLHHFTEYSGEHMYSCKKHGKVCDLSCQREHGCKNTTADPRLEILLESDIRASICVLCNGVQLSQGNIVWHLENEHKIISDEVPKYMIRVKLFPFSSKHHRSKHSDDVKKHRTHRTATVKESNAMERSQPEVVKTKTATKADETNGLHRKVNDSKSSTQTSKKESSNKEVEGSNRETKLTGSKTKSHQSTTKCNSNFPSHQNNDDLKKKPDCLTVNKTPSTKIAVNDSRDTITNRQQTAKVNTTPQQVTKPIMIPQRTTKSITMPQQATNERDYLNECRLVKSKIHGMGNSSTEASSGRNSEELDWLNTEETETNFRCERPSVPKQTGTSACHTTSNVNKFVSNQNAKTDTHKPVVEAFKAGSVYSSVHQPAPPFTLMTLARPMTTQRHESSDYLEQCKNKLLKLMHTPSQKLYCCNCNKGQVKRSTFASEQGFRMHVLTTHRRKFTCPRCSLCIKASKTRIGSSTHFNEVSKHLSTHVYKSGNLQCFECSRCGKRDSDVIYLILHSKQAHENQKVELKFKPTSSPAVMVLISFICCHCRHTFCTAKEIKQHFLNVHQTYAIDAHASIQISFNGLCSEPVTTKLPQWQVPFSIKDENTNRQAFELASSDSQHVGKSMSENPSKFAYTCPYIGCENLSFATMLAIKEHSVIHANGKNFRFSIEKRFRCSHCSNSGTFDAIQLHFKQNHSNLNPTLLTMKDLSDGTSCGSDDSIQGFTDQSLHALNQHGMLVGYFVVNCCRTTKKSMSAVIEHINECQAAIKPIERALQLTEVIFTNGFTVKLKYLKKTSIGNELNAKLDEHHQQFDLDSKELEKQKLWQNSLYIGGIPKKSNEVLKDYYEKIRRLLTVPAHEVLEIRRVCDSGFAVELEKMSVKDEFLQRSRDKKLYLSDLVPGANKSLIYISHRLTPLYRELVTIAMDAIKKKSLYAYYIDQGMLARKSRNTKFERITNKQQLQDLIRS